MRDNVQVKHFPGPSILDVCKVGEARDVVTIRGTVWTDSAMTITIESGAMSGQLRVSPRQLDELRQMLADLSWCAATVARDEVQS